MHQCWGILIGDARKQSMHMQRSMQRSREKTAPGMRGRTLSNFYTSCSSLDSKAIGSGMSHKRHFFVWGNPKDMSFMSRRPFSDKSCPILYQCQFVNSANSKITATSLYTNGINMILKNCNISWRSLSYNPGNDSIICMILLLILHMQRFPWGHQGFSL